ncbi:FAD-dependent oxidoreductase [Winogradskya consettensis]|uniref:Monoamine oxidase n=1 Tax=Winogradskya consettensis TaxID=113560 RepID=A0A919VY53_9ACTN|nr:NAD(P)/FAD-dependent oxidoreductase [Actinoplanes consettensis]GIM82007.1 monoamine oxidase [Actinoplanes consettensis]
MSRPDTSASGEPRVGTNIGRRTLLKAFGATAVAGAAATTLGARPASAETSYDVIVIGAGFAGVTAARELRAAGRRPLILEARNRIGGRTWTTTFAGKQIELGGQWLYPTQVNAQAELTRYGIDLVPGEIAPNQAFYPTPAGQAAFEIGAATTQFNALMSTLFADSRQLFPRPYEPLSARSAVSQADTLSLRTKINSLPITAQDKMWLLSLAASYSGGSSDRGGFTSMAQWWALAGHTPAGWESLTSYRPVGGMVALLTRILLDAQAQLVLNSPVTRIVDSGSSVTVTTTTATYTAPRVVVAVPANVWRTISFSPGLPAAHAAATQAGLGVPNVTKMWLRVSGPSAQALTNGAEGEQISLILPQNQLSNGDILAVGFSENPSLDVTNLSQVQAAAQRVAPGIQVKSVISQPWGRDPYSLGAWGMRGPNQLLQQLPAVQQPSGRLAFATADIASGWNGAFIDGAIESGRTAARQTLATS